MCHSLSVFYPPFIGPTPETANVSGVADHIEYIATIVGRDHVGIASDFDGMYSSVIGLEDASKYPNLVSLIPPSYLETIASDIT
jgi:membrane dipeptidase